MHQSVIKIKYFGSQILTIDIPKHTFQDMIKQSTKHDSKCLDDSIRFYCLFQSKNIQPKQKKLTKVNVFNCARNLIYVLSSLCPWGLTS